jgi:phytoene dehydrogenase-like protein
LFFGVLLLLSSSGFGWLLFCCIVSQPLSTKTKKNRLDPSLAPPGRHIVHAFTPDWIDSWQGLEPAAYEAAKEAAADALVARLERLWPGLAAATEFREVRLIDV